MSFKKPEIEYFALLRSALSEYDEFSLLWRKPRKKDEEGFGYQETLRLHLKKEEYTNKWPGTEIFYGKELVSYYELNKNTLSLLKVVESVFDWGEGGLPEDLTFYSNGKPRFISISHEGDAWHEET